MKVRLVNYKKLAFGFIKKSQIADNQHLYKLSSKYFSLAHKIYRVANTELQEKIDKNKNVVRESNRIKLSEFIEDEPNKGQIYAFFQSLEFPYDINFGDPSREDRKSNFLRFCNLLIKLSEKGINSDIALVTVQNQNEIIYQAKSGHRNLTAINVPSDIERNPDSKVNVLLQFLESRNQKYGFAGDRRMGFRTPALLLDLYLELFNIDNLPPLLLDRKDYLNLMYSEGENFSFDKEHFDSALHLNYILGKHSIPFVQKCQTESSGNSIVDIPHIVDNTINLSKIEYDPKITEFIIKNYFNINLRREIENKLRKDLNLSEEDYKKYTNEIMTSDDIVKVSYEFYRKSDFIRDATTKLRKNLSSVISNWNRPIRIQGEEFKLVSEMSNMPLEKLRKTITNDVAAEDIGYENITNERLFQAMLKYQEDDIKSFLEVQKLMDERPEESEWYVNLSKLRVENDSYIARVLPKNDSRFAFVGAITGCCQKIKGAGNKAFLNTFGSDSGIFIITDKKDNLVAQSYIWINQSTISLDSIESKYSSFNHQDFKDIYEKACNEIFSKYFDVVLCGSNNTSSRFSDAEKFIPLNIFENNDPNTYTYDTLGGRSVLFAKPESFDKYPILSVFDTTKNNLNKPYNDDEIKIIINNQNIKNNICNSLVKKYINELQDVINKDNLLKLYDQLGKPTFPEDFYVLCLVMERPDLIDFDDNLNKTQFQIMLNKWLRDGNHLKDSNQESDIQQLKRDLAKIESFNYPTKLYNAQKIFGFINFEEKMSKFETSDLIYSLNDEDKNYLSNLITETTSISDFLGKKINLEDLKYNSSAYDFFSFLLKKYIQKNQLSNDDIKFVNDNMFNRSWDENNLINSIETGFIDYYLMPLDDDEILLPTSDYINSIRYYVENYNQNQDSVQYGEKIKLLITKILNNINLYPSNSETNYRLGSLAHACVSNNFGNLDINDYNVQKMITKSGSGDKIPQELNTLYISILYQILYIADNLTFAPIINLIVDQQNFYGLNKLKNIQSIQQIKVIFKESITLNRSQIENLSEASDNEIIYDKKVLLEMLEDILSFSYLEINLKESYRRKENFKDIVLNNLLSDRYLQKIKNQLNNMLPEINQLIQRKISAYRGYVNIVPNVDPYVLEMLKQPITTPEPQPRQPEEQNEITANRKTLRYSIKQK